MKKLTEREHDLLKALSGTAKSAASLLVPVLGQAVAGYDAYRRATFERSVTTFMAHIAAKVDHYDKFLQQAYFNTEEGRVFTRKAVDAALDVQLEDKQEFFVNALINAPTSPDLPELQKLKYVDMLRALSLASLTVLAEMHKLFIGQVRGPGRPSPPPSPYPHVDVTRIVQSLASRFDPYLVAAVITEMQGQGLFSRTAEWRKDSGGHVSPGGFATELSYTHFDASFVEFITPEQQRSEAGR